MAMCQVKFMDSKAISSHYGGQLAWKVPRSYSHCIFLRKILAATGPRARGVCPRPGQADPA